MCSAPDGEFIYENDTLKIIQHEEGRIIPPSGGTEGGEYQYNLKDHLGNVRMTFTTKEETESATATLESANLASEQAEFLRIENARRVYATLFDKTNGSSPGHAARLNGSTNEKYGLAKSLSVMPGDTIKMEVYAKYVDGNQSNWTQALSDLITAVNANTAGVVVDGSGYSVSTPSFNYAGLLNTSGSSGNGPKAYLNWLVFDRDYNFLNGGYQRISDVAKEYGQDVAHEKLSASILATEPGYVYIYLSNEETTPVDVFFDDFKVEQVKSPVIQLDDYYPFGLTYNSYAREKSIAQNFKYNGVENEDELELNVNSTFFRAHDPAVGRWWQIDPKPNPMNSLYSAMDNNPIRYSDPLGDTIIVDKKGYITRNDNTDNLVFIQGKKGKLTAIGELGKKINANTIYKNLLKANAKTAKGIWSPFTFKNMVKNKGEWDLKNNTKTIYGLANHYKESATTFSFNGKDMSAQDMGNHHFGVVGKAYGLFPEETMLREAGAGQMAAGTSKPEWQKYEVRQVTGERGATSTVRVMLPPYGDDPRDQEMIKEGFKYYKEHKDDDDDDNN